MDSDILNDLKNLSFKTQKEILYQKFNETLKTKLTAKQILKIHIAEEKFHRKMVHQSRNKKNIP